MRRFRILMTLGWLVLPLAFLCGCDENKELSQKERLFRLGASAGSVCPQTDPDNPGNPARGEIDIIGTVFGRDGSTAQGVPVTFQTDFGCFDPDGSCVMEIEQSTGKDGVAKVHLGLTRPADDNILIQALVDNTIDASLQILVPRPPQIRISPYSASPKVGETFLVYVDGSILCDVYRIDVDLSYDPATVDYDDSVDFSHLDKDTDGSDVATDHSLIDTPGKISVSYYRTNSPLTGVSESGTFITFRFKALAAGDGKLAVDSFTYTSVEGRSYPSLEDQTFVSPVTVLAASGKGGGAGRR